MGYYIQFYFLNLPHKYILCYVPTAFVDAILFCTVLNCINVYCMFSLWYGLVLSYIVITCRLNFLSYLLSCLIFFIFYYRI